MKKQSHRLATLVTVASLFLTTPGLAFADDHAGHDTNHGPMPIAALGSLFGGAFWLASAPLCLLIAPKHLGDSFDLLVAAPWRAAVGSETH